MIARLTGVIENNLTPIMVLSILAGFLIPQLAAIPDFMIVIFLGGLIFFSCQSIKIEDVRAIPVKSALSFYCVRFLMLPIILYGVASYILPDLKTGILLLALVPAGTAAAAFTTLLGGSAALSFGIVVFSGLLAPFVIPAVMALLGYGALNIDLWGILITAAQVVFIPVLSWFLIARKIPPVRRVSARYGKALSVILIFMIISIALAKQHDYIYADPLNIAYFLLILALVFTALFMFGWCWPHGKDRKLRIANTINSGVMNNALGLSLALLYFPPQIALFMALSEIPWSLSLPAFQAFLSRKRS